MTTQVHGRAESPFESLHRAFEDALHAEAVGGALRAGAQPGLVSPASERYPERSDVRGCGAVARLRGSCAVDRSASAAGGLTGCGRFRVRRCVLRW
jgi:hypothetical protein